MACRPRWRRWVCRLARVPVEVFTDDRHQPAGQRHGAAAGAAFGVGLERGVPADFDRSADDRETGAVHIDCVETQSGGFSQRRPAPAAVAMIARYRSGAAGSSLLRSSSRLMTWSVVSW